jgi:predicted RNase H-like HicB family nuclease
LSKFVGCDTLGVQDGDGVSCRRATSAAAGRIGMATTMYTAIIEKEGNLYAALCPELDVASQGTTVEEATSNLQEAVELFLECADPEEIKRRRRTEVLVTRIEAKHG